MRTPACEGRDVGKRLKELEDERMQRLKWLCDRCQDTGWEKAAVVCEACGNPGKKREPGKAVEAEMDPYADYYSY